VAALAFAGLRAGELADLRWRDVDLAAGRIYVGRSKTDAGLREVDLLPILRDELLQHRLAADSADPDDRVFTTARGGVRDRNNIGLRVMRPVLERADELLAERGEHPLPEGVTAHKLRHTFASVLIALGRDPAYVMAQLGHADPGFTLRVYTHAMRRGDGEREALRALVEGREWAQMGTNPAEPPSPSVIPAHADPAELQAESGETEVPPGGFEPPTPGLGNLCSIP
jgi:integrase